MGSEQRGGVHLLLGRRGGARLHGGRGARLEINACRDAIGQRGVGLVLGVTRGDGEVRAVLNRGVHGVNAPDALLGRDKDGGAR
jgi:hypothetical protein